MPRKHKHIAKWPPRHCEKCKHSFAAYFVVQENQILHWQVRGKQGRSAWPEEWYSMQQVTFKAKHRTMGEHKDKGKFNTGRKGKSFSIWRCGPSLPCRPTPLSRQVGMQNWIVKITTRRQLLHNYQHTNRTYGEGWKEIGATHQFCHRTGALLRWPCPLVFWAPFSSSPWMNAPEFTCCALLLWPPCSFSPWNFCSTTTFPIASTANFQPAYPFR